MGAVKKRKRPAIQLYVKDWLYDFELRLCSPAARGLWIDLMCMMHDGQPYGHLSFPRELILRIVGLSAEEYDRLLAELETERETGKKVAYRTEAGVLYSKRMALDEEFRRIAAENGGHGGRPRKDGAARVTSPAVFPEVPNAEEGWDAEAAFEEMWTAYPAKGRVRKIEAQHAFVEKIRSRTVFGQAMDAIRGKFARSEKWAKGFVMALPSWIAQECWGEEPEPAAGSETGGSMYKKWEPERS